MDAELLLLDLASVRFHMSPTRAHMAAYTCADELLAVVDVPFGTDDREAAFLACNDALTRARVSRPLGQDVVRARIALYNPYTFQVSVGPVPHTQVFAGGRLALPAGGALARPACDTDRRERLDVLDDEGLVTARLHPVEVSAQSVWRVLHAGE